MSSKLGFKLSDATITPTIVFGLAILPLSKASLKTITIVQQIMMRKIDGRVRLESELWETTMRRMKHRVDQVLYQYPVVWWVRRFAVHLW